MDRYWQLGRVSVQDKKHTLLINTNQMNLDKNSFLTFYSAIIILLWTCVFFDGITVLLAWPYTLIYVMLIILLHNKLIFNKSILWLLLFFVVAFINYMTGETYTWYADFSSTVVEFLYWFFPATLFLTIANSMNFRGLKIITIVSLLITVIISFCTISISIKDPTLVRMAVVMKEADLVIYRKMGLTHYGMPHALPFIIPPLVYFIKYCKPILTKIITIALLLIILTLIVIAGVTTPLLLAFIMLVISLLINPQKTFKKNVIKMVFFGIVAFILMNYTILLKFLRLLTNSSLGTAYEAKIIIFENLIKYNEVTGDLSERNDLYSSSWNTFFDNFLFGTNDSKLIGQHAFFVDHLAAFGIVGTIPLFVFLYLIFKKTYSCIPKPLKMYYLIGISGFLLLEFTKNVSGMEIRLYSFVLLPFLCIWAGLSETKPLKKEKRWLVPSKENTIFSTNNEINL